MTSILAPSGAKEMRIQAVVTRADGRVENLGTVAYWHKNPLRRLAFKISQFARRLFAR